MLSVCADKPTDNMIPVSTNKNAFVNFIVFNNVDY